MKVLRPMRQYLRSFFRDPTRALAAGLFTAGLFYAVLWLSEGHWLSLGAITAVVVEATLLYLSLFRSPPDKKDLAILGSIALALLITAWLFGVLSHVVVMAIGGMALYAALLSEPKYPLTKRAMGTGVIVGVVMTFMAIYLALKLGVVFLVGAEMLGAILLSVYGRYTAQENTIVVTIANSSSMIAVGVLIVFPAIAIFDPTVAYGSPLADPPIPPLITYEFIVYVTITAALFGMLLLAPLRDRFEDEPWPQVQPQARTITSIGGDTEAKKTVGIGLAASGVWMGASQPLSNYFTGSPFSSFPNVLRGAIPAAGAVPDWIGINNSPMIAGIGFFVGWKRTLVIAAGSVMSLFVWFVIEGANSAVAFGAHLQRAEILYLALGVFVTIIAGDVVTGRKEDTLTPEQYEEEVNTPAKASIEDGVQVDSPHKTEEIPRLLRVREELFSIETFKIEIREMVRNPREYLKSHRGQVPPWVAVLSMVLFMMVNIIVFWFIKPFGGLEIHWLLIILGSPLALVSAYFTARAISETGMLAGYISDIVAIPAVLFFRVTFSVITTFISMLGAVQDAAIALLVHLKLGRLTGVRGRDIAKAVFIGVMLGAFVGGAITYMIFITYGFGGSDFPSPAAQLFGFLVTSLEGLGDFRLPGLSQFEGVNPILAFMYLVCYAVVGFVSGRELLKRGMSPMSLVVGILIPPATSVAMLIGGAIDYRMKKRLEYIDMAACAPEDRPTQTRIYDMSYDRTSRILSGVVAGEAVVTVAWVMIDAFLTVT
jgi:hypothetical protein